ncbi:acetyltransferase [Polynucleobacter sp. AM-25C3]|nr:acetyltransferase [Polynucleobacter sp. AM-25C3]
MVKRVAIFGASGCGRGVLPLARKQLEVSNQEYKLVFVDDQPSSSVVNGHQVLTYSEWLSQPASSRHINIAIANSVIREKLVERSMSDGVQFFEVRASNVVELDDVKIGDGAILCPFVTLTSNIRIGKHFHANIYSYVEHDCVIGDYVTFAPGVKCNGNIHIEDHAYIGSGAVIKQGTPDRPLVIGRGAVVGMGAVVTKSVPPNTTVVGNPARPMNKS